MSDDFLILLNFTECCEAMPTFISLRLLGGVVITLPGAGTIESELERL